MSIKEGILPVKEYVICYVPREPHHIVIVQKEKPAWQFGLWNLPGGKLEMNETIEACAERELKEETDMIAGDSEIMGQLVGDAYCVYVVRCNVQCYQQARTMGREQIFTKSIREVLESERLIPNLRLVIPLCLAGIKDFEIRDFDPAQAQSVRDFRVRI